MRSEVLRKMQLPPWSDNREIRAEAIRAMQANTTQLDPGLRKKLRRSCKEKYAQMNFDVTVSTWTLSNCLVEYDGQKRLSSKPGLTKEERLSSKPGLKEGDCPSAKKEQRLLIKVKDRVQSGFHRLSEAYVQVSVWDFKQSSRQLCRWGVSCSVHHCRLMTCRQAVDSEIFPLTV